MKKLYFILTALLFSSLGFAQSDVVKFQADIAKRNGDMLYIKDNNKIIQEIKLDKGIFKASFPVKEGMYQLFDGVEYAMLYLKNGYDLKMTMDASQFDESIKFSGTGAKENNYLAQETLSDEGAGYEKMLNLEEEGFKKAIEEVKNRNLEKMNKAGLDPAFVTMNKVGLDTNLLGLQQYYSQISANKKMNNTVSATFDYENHKGGKTKLEDLRGKYVYIDVWATWCGPCRAEIPSLKVVEEKFHEKNIAFVSISIDVEKDHEKWKKFVTEKDLGGIQLFADKDWKSDFIASYKINSIPRFILIDPTGKIVDADAARPSDPRLTAQLESLVK
ncbi:TlpA disulfide reductase family protein [Flavobacterium sp.]|uniref:TlpA family protein disulfide reductase n=1 Tax=Flavobacterium sp. TaxID=239 RepID=UPI002489F42B|nr:TlpA disulfide reductase family protein [Flavobacterium sp.]MDI1316655.1 TlpA disulfide reductase family protein [Flavobacterium sp.]